MKQKVVSDYSKLKPSDLLTKALEVLNGIKGNANFPTLQSEMAAFENVTTDYQKAIIEAESRDRKAIAKRDGLTTLVQTMLGDFADVVNTIAKGNMEMMLSSGLNITKHREPTKLTMPQIESIKQGEEPGSMIVKVAKGCVAPGGFIYQCATSADAADKEWISVYAKVTKCTIPGLQQGQKYWFRVIAVSSRGQQLCGQATARYTQLFVME